MVVFSYAMFYERFRNLISKWQNSSLEQVHFISSASSDDHSDYVSSNRPVSNDIKLHGAVLNGALILYSYTLMLIVMTYNCYLIAAVILGAIVGHFYFNDSLSNNSGSLACH
ncbi:hypothetical protein BB560_003891 [Smittium megazygosporum]|uniref:Copper transport protein n=1 Tax=Smittium megazygosporum TaxID=133381 RepID=A0A2T9ZAN8_9FUNG|nr:hypothetical protein BB560_003891 [Smittium megazygosporum]